MVKGVRLGRMGNKCDLGALYEISKSLIETLCWGEGNWEEYMRGFWEKLERVKVTDQNTLCTCFQVSDSK